MLACHLHIRMQDKLSTASSAGFVRRYINSAHLSLGGGVFRDHLCWHEKASVIQTGWDCWGYSLTVGSTLQRRWRSDKGFICITERALEFIYDYRGPNLLRLFAPFSIRGWFYERANKTGDITIITMGTKCASLKVSQSIKHIWRNSQIGPLISLYCCSVYKTKMHKWIFKYFP